MSIKNLNLTPIPILFLFPLFNQPQRMFEAGRFLPALVAGDDEAGAGKFFEHPVYGGRPGFEVGIGKVADGIGFIAFHKAAAVKDLFFPKPYHYIIRRMAMAGEEGLKAGVGQIETGIFFKYKGSLRIVFCLQNSRVWRLLQVGMPLCFMISNPPVRVSVPKNRQFEIRV